MFDKLYQQSEVWTEKSTESTIIAGNIVVTGATLGESVAGSPGSWLLNTVSWRGVAGH